MVQSEQITVDHIDADLIFGSGGRHSGNGSFANYGAQPDEQAAREALRGQVSKLERELSGLVAGTFPHISPRDEEGEAFSGPRLLSLAELERVRDRLALRVGEVRGQVAERTALEQRSRVLLQRMKLEPGRYKFVRVPVADLGDGHCGVWEVRPRLGLIGMLAGWWQVKLSSGCP
ncbi:MAG: hypothetical protein WAU42_02995 [Solirubrobacteraceae bacterium]